MPNQPKTPISSFRIPSDLKKAVKAKAEAEGRTVSDVVVAALRRYVRSK
jgi:NRPS condensation-like uncharacterized protein